MCNCIFCIIYDYINYDVLFYSVFISCYLVQFDLFCTVVAVFVSSEPALSHADHIQIYV